MRRVPKEIWVGSIGSFPMPTLKEARRLRNIGDPPLPEASAETIAMFAKELDALHVDLIVCGPERRSREAAQIFSVESELDHSIPITTFEQLAALKFPEGEQLVRLLKGFGYYSGELENLWVGGSTEIESPREYAARISDFLEKKVIEKLSVDEIPLIISDEPIIWAARNIFESIHFQEAIKEKYPAGSLVKFFTGALYPF